MIAPGNVLLGTTTAGILGREGEVLRVKVPLLQVLASVGSMFGIRMRSRRSASDCSAAACW